MESVCLGERGSGFLPHQPASFNQGKLLAVAPSLFARCDNDTNMLRMCDRQN